MTEIKPFTLTIDEELWAKFKATVNRDRTLNQAVIDLIEYAVYRYSMKKKSPDKLEPMRR